MNKRLKKQIKAYAGFAAALLVAEKANGQIVYVDVNPDSTILENNSIDTLATFFSIDIDGDSVYDFDFKVKCINCTSSWNTGYIKIHPLNNNKVNNALYHSGWFSGNNFALNARKLACGDTINGNGTWLDSEKYLFSSQQGSVSTDWTWQGAWHPISDGYLPFLLFKNSNTYYGWMHIKTLSRQTFIISEYAYQTQPNFPILACDTANLATQTSNFNQQPFYFSQQNNSIHISTFQNLNHANILVYDLLGKELLQQSFSGKETTVTIDKKGIYFVEVNSDKGIFRKKIFIY